MAAWMLVVGHWLPGAGPPVSSLVHSLTWHARPVLYDILSHYTNELRHQQAWRLWHTRPPTKL